MSRIAVLFYVLFAVLFAFSDARLLEKTTSASQSTVESKRNPSEFTWLLKTNTLPVNNLIYAKGPAGDAFRRSIFTIRHPVRYGQHKMGERGDDEFTKQFQNLIHH